VHPRLQLANLDVFSVKTARPAVEWTDLNLRPDLIASTVEGLRHARPLPMQASVLPALLASRNVLLAAQTGSGKTLAYLLALFARLKREEEGLSVEELAAMRAPLHPRAVVLVPTLELVYQVHRIAKRLSHYCRMKVEHEPAVLFQHSDQRVDLLVTTPKQLLAAFDAKSLKTAALRHVIVDEADTLLARDFGDEIKRLLLQLPQPLLSFAAVSATITVSLKKTVHRLHRDVKTITLNGLHEPAPAIRQRFVNIDQPGAAKARLCLQMIGENPGSRILVFCRTVKSAEQLHAYLCEAISGSVPGQETSSAAAPVSSTAAPVSSTVTPVSSTAAPVSSTVTPIASTVTPIASTVTPIASTVAPVSSTVTPVSSTVTPVSSTAAPIASTAAPIVLPGLFHGSLSPIQRQSIYAKFTEGHIRVLVATDLAARGLDTSWVNHVINYDFPHSVMDYLHRVGRTARAGRGGKVTSLVTRKDKHLASFIQLAIKSNQPFSKPLAQ
jgi:superfamily II DNA/RNA helicase